MFLWIFLWNSGNRWNLEKGSRLEKASRLEISSKLEISAGLEISASWQSDNISFITQKKSNWFNSVRLFGWLRPTFPGPYGPSIIGDAELNFCVRNGNRCILYSIATTYLMDVPSKLHIKIHFLDQVLDLLVLISWICYHTYTLSLSTT